MTSVSARFQTAKATAHWKYPSRALRRQSLSVPTRPAVLRQKLPEWRGW
ncbi:CRISPR-associated protein Cas5 [Roseibium sp. MMSF_3544]